MADPILIQRLTHLLHEASESTPKGEGFWPTLADLAAAECARTVVVEQRGLPSQPFAAVRKTHEGLAIVARGVSLVEIQNAATTVLETRGVGEVWLLEIRRVLGVA